MRVVIFVCCSMLERRGFDDVLARALEVSRHNWNGTDIGDPIMEGRKEMIGLGGCDMHYRRDARRPRLSQEQDIALDVREVGHDGGELGQGPA